MTIARLRVDLAGTAVVGPSLMTFYSRNLTNSLPAAVKSFITSCGVYVPPGVTFTIPNGGDEIDEATGALVGSWTSTGGGTVVGSSQGNYILGVGARVEWSTGAPVNGHHVRGRTFLVPLGANCFDSGGRVVGSVHDAFQSAASALITAGGGDLVIWSRPRKAGSGKNHNLPARAGAAVPVTASSVPLLPTSLRSRRV